MLSLLLSLLSPAQAFCGVYVSPAEGPLTNAGSQVAMVRQGDKTTLTLENDYEGPSSEFAMLIPVPVVLQEDDVRVVSSDLMERLDTYSAPRVVYYTCDMLNYDYAQASAMPCGCVEYESSVQAYEDGSASTVKVENTFAVGSYEIVILSTETASDLMEWLDLNGYNVPAEVEDKLTEYIEADSYFFAAKVSLDAKGEGKNLLTPLQFSYTSELMTLPLRLGTANSAGEQDLVVYVLSDGETGSIGISNYPESPLPSDCMPRLDEGESYPDFYAAELAAAMPGATGAAWATEYAWTPSSCDPCPPSGPLDPQDLKDLGFEGNAEEAYFTRLRMRYTPEGMTQDPVFYPSNLSQTFQVRYIQYNRALEEFFEVCGEGFIEDGGTCDDDTAGEPEDDSGAQEASFGPNVGWLLAALGLGMWKRRGS